MLLACKEKSFRMDAARRKEQEKGLRMRISPTCTLSQNGYGNRIVLLLLEMSTERLNEACATSGVRYPIRAAGAKPAPRARRPDSRRACGPVQLTEVPDGSALGRGPRVRDRGEAPPPMRLLAGVEHCCCSREKPMDISFCMFGCFF